MSLFEKLQTVFMLLAVALGMLLGQSHFIAEHASSFIAPSLMCMLFGLFLGIPLTDLKTNFNNRKFTLTSLVINFVWIPILGWWLGGLFLGDSPALRIGFVMLLVTPCTDWYLLFTSIAKGNVALSAALLPINLIVQVLLLPFYLLLFAGISGYIDLKLLASSIIMVLVVPFGLAQIVRSIVKDEKKPLRRFLSSFFSGGQFVFLCLAIVGMFASQAQYLYNNLDIFFKLLLPVLLFFGINFIVVRLVAKLMHFPYDDSVSLSLTTLARNSPISLAVAVTAFPDEPLVALALVIGPLMELPILALIAQLLLFTRPKEVCLASHHGSGEKL